jgi:alkylation response protein AidB-like acyl-CoA dehydrogenase
MDFVADELEQSLQEGVRSLCEGRFGIDAVRAMADQPGAVDRGRWRELAETGVFALRLPEDAGGVGLGLTQANLVFQELGRALVPGPLVGTHLAASLATAAGSGGGAGELGEAAASGNLVVGGIDRDEQPLLVEHLEALDVLLVLDEAGIWRVDPSELAATPVARPLDPLTPLHEVASLPQGEQVGDAELGARWRQEGAILVGSLLVGNATAATELAVAYAKEREQFGKPIGAFQAVKHLCADMITRATVARAAVDAAAVTADDPDVGDLVRAVSSAKIVAGEAALANAKSCIQVHGGMGFTWEVDAQLLFKRATVLDTQLGTVDDHAELLAQLL